MIENKTELIQIEKHVKQYAAIISSAMKVDVEIIDKDMIRIAGTGIFKKSVGVTAKGSVYKDVLKTGEPHIIREPGKDKLCITCPEKDRCPETLEISTPIFYNSEIIGVIGLVCSTNYQKEKVLENLNSHLKFIKQISEFISIKINEQNDNLFRKERAKLFYEILSVIDKGVIVLDENSKVVNLNNSAMKELELSPNSLNKKINIENKDEFLFGKETYEVTITASKKSYIIVGKKFKTDGLKKETYQVFIFDSIKKLNDEFQQLSAERALGIEAIIGESYPMLRLKGKIKKIAPTKSTVLITGESGTGKELVARAIHAHSDRKDKPFIAINCAAIPDSLLESELFGYIKGAFSGASSNGRMGKFELANKGVIFLDEIGDMPLYLQAKLLRVLQERKLVRIGSNKLMDLDIRVLAATNIDLKERIEKKKFREDLYYRLNVIPIEIPNLKSRGKDILLIIEQLMKKYNKVLNKYVHTIDIETKKILMSYEWPGNVRELENVVEFMINLSDESGIITKDLLPDNLISEEKSDVNILEGILTIADAEKILIDNAINKYGNNTSGKKEAAKELGIGIATLYRKVEKYNI
ncbi:sigma-54-dependent Fis family transcriptional regulator [Psychrilyobacter atlanticus]|uniref:sigma-54-dependent Fis family transcriptional regulator n=1 Tax=Psychrilyobacter atlanticus TaxID=271091 RepID=UPI00040FD781|nr:sigma 54-interacting transcriptional regulator [Psychrilyobacter atlanticus]